jgi:methyl acetate hydrolase
MIRKPDRRDVLKTTVTLAAAGYFGAARARSAPLPGNIDSVLRAAVQAADIPGIVALAATDDGVVYEGVFGQRRLPGGPAMTPDTVFRIASMVKAITSVAALQLVEQGKLSLDAPVPAIEPALNEPHVLDGFDAKGTPQLRPAKSPITLRQLLTHTAGFTYRLWDAKSLRYGAAIGKMPAAARGRLPRTPLMFDPGTRWQYGPNIDWVGKIVEHVSGEPVDTYFRNHILAPLSMRDTGFTITSEQRAQEASAHRREADGSLQALSPERPQPHATFTGGGGIYSTAPDYLTFLRMLMYGGTLAGVRILRPETVAMMGRNQIGAIDVGVLRTTAPAFSSDVDLFPGVTCKWGLGHMLTIQAIAGGRSAGSMTWGGLYNTYYWIDPVRHVAAVFMTQVMPFADQRALRVYRQFEHGIYAAL